MIHKRCHYFLLLKSITHDKSLGQLQGELGLTHCVSSICKVLFVWLIWDRIHDCTANSNWAYLYRFSWRWEQLQVLVYRVWPRLL